jgi:hypothetical protein
MRTEMSQQLAYYPHNAYEEVLHNYHYPYAVHLGEYAWTDVEDGLLVYRVTRIPRRFHQ